MYFRLKKNWIEFIILFKTAWIRNIYDWYDSVLGVWFPINSTTFVWEKCSELAVLCTTSWTLWPINIYLNRITLISLYCFCGCEALLNWFVMSVSYEIVCWRIIKLEWGEPPLNGALGLKVSNRRLYFVFKMVQAPFRHCFFFLKYHFSWKNWKNAKRYPSLSSRQNKCLEMCAHAIGRESVFFSNILNLFSFCGWGPLL